MKHSAILYIADREINKMMKAFDLCPDHKVFVALQEISFETTTQVNEEYFMKIIEESKKNEKFWIPVIKYMDNVFIGDDKIKIISDGTNQIFIRPAS